MDITLSSAGVRLPGLLERPAGGDQRGWVIFAHGSGSSRLSPRNQEVASSLRQAGLGTLLFDLLTPDEDRRDRVTAEHRFDIDLLARRLTGALDWLTGPDGITDANGAPVGLFGASTGAAAALVSAADRPDAVRAVVSRGGRPDLAGTALGLVRAPTLLIVGSLDEHVLELNRRAANALAAPHEVAVVAGAGHLFEEPGALVEVCGLASRWFARHSTS